MRRDLDGRTPLRLTAARPSDLVGLVPYLLGFRPAESLVVVHLRAGRVVVTSRLDLAADRGVEADDYADSIRRLAERHPIDALLVLVYTDQPAGFDLAAALADRLADDGLVEALHVSSSRWWSATCEGTCCPPEGTPYDLTSHPLSAAAVLAGMNALPDRSTMAEWVRGPAPGDLPDLERAVRAAQVEVAELSLGRRSRLIRRLVGSYLVGRRPLDDAECAMLAVLAEDVRIRDAACAAISRRRADDHVDLWRQVVARTPDEVAAGPICLLGMAAWVAGNGALQNLCIDRMVEVDPSYSMTGLLVDINQQGMSPAVWDGLAKEIRRELKRMGG